MKFSRSLTISMAAATSFSFSLSSIISTNSVAFPAFLLHAGLVSAYVVPSIESEEEKRWLDFIRRGETIRTAPAADTATTDAVVDPKAQADDKSKAKKATDADNIAFNSTDNNAFMDFTPPDGFICHFVGAGGKGKNGTHGGGMGMHKGNGTMGKGHKKGKDKNMGKGKGMGKGTGKAQTAAPTKGTSKANDMSKGAVNP